MDKSISKKSSKILQNILNSKDKEYLQSLMLSYSFSEEVKRGVKRNNLLLYLNNVIYIVIF